MDLFIVFNATFSNISAISWRPVLVVEEAGVPQLVNRILWSVIELKYSPLDVDNVKQQSINHIKQRYRKHVLTSS